MTETHKKSGIYTEADFKEKTQEAVAKDFAADFAAESEPPVIVPMWDASGNSMN